MKGAYFDEPNLFKRALRRKIHFCGGVRRRGLPASRPPAPRIRLRLRGGDGLLQVRREQMDLARRLLPELGPRLAGDFAGITLDGKARESRET